MDTPNSDGRLKPEDIEGSIDNLLNNPEGTLERLEQGGSTPEPPRQEVPSPDIIGQAAETGEAKDEAPQAQVAPEQDIEEQKADTEPGKDRASRHEHFRQWLSKFLREKYKEYCMDQRLIAKHNFEEAITVTVPNGTQNREYQGGLIILPCDGYGGYTFEGLDGTGMMIVPETGNSYSVKGMPLIAGDIEVTLKYRHESFVDDDEPLEYKFRIIINSDPRSLWRDIPTPADVEFYKPDTATAYVEVKPKDGQPRKDIVAASRRGRSHAHSGIPRDDDFKLYHCDQSDWYIMAVADGAGSAKYSREGSRVACNTVVQNCREMLQDNTEFEADIQELQDAMTSMNADTINTKRKNFVVKLYSILANAAYIAHRAINKLSAETPGTKPKDFATTLMLAVCKKFDFGWFYATFWVGDGAICLYDKPNNTFELLGVPDEGEFSGQTRFLTMPEIFQDGGTLINRLRFGIKSDFTALMMMTDGVSDPMFGTDANLNNIDKWNELWEKLIKGIPDSNISGVHLRDDYPELQQELLDWLTFWQPGEHDDRTIAILY